MEQYGRSRVKRLLLRIVLALVAGVVWWLANRHAHASAPPVRTIRIHARKFEFIPAEITLKQGEQVRLMFISDDVTHALAIEGLAMHAELVKGHPVVVLLTPPGTRRFPGQMHEVLWSGTPGHAPGHSCCALSEGQRVHARTLCRRARRL